MVSFLITLFFSYFKWLDRYDLQVLDFKISNQDETSLKGHDDIVMLFVDEASLSALSNTLGRWPWDRKIWSEVIEFLNMFEVEHIIFDILFTETQMPRSQDYELGESDIAFAMSTMFAENIIHSAQFFVDNEDESNHSLLNRPLPEGVGLALDPSLVDISLDANNYSLPFEELFQASSSLAVVNMTPDKDGVYRRVPLFFHYQGEIMPTLGIAHLVSEGEEIRYDRDNHRVIFQDLKLPLQDDGRYLVNMKRDFNIYSMSGLLATMQAFNRGDYDQLMIDPSELAGKTVIVGLSAVGLGDVKATSVGAVTPGPLIHGSVLSNVLSGDFIERKNGLMIWALIVLISTLICLSVLFAKSFYLQILPTLFLTLGWGLVSFYLFFQNSQWVSIVYPVFSFVITFVFSYIYLSFTEGAEKRKTRKMLAQYVSPHVLKEVMDKQDSLTAEVGKEEHLSILFSDVRGFTAFSEAAPASQVVEMLNFYLDSMVDIVFECQGTLDKFIGDALMAFFGAPLRTKEHAKHAVQAAMMMSQKLVDINQYFDSKGFPPFEIGIGIHTGEVILGNIGSSKKLDYTVIGDNVNLASRMEGLTKPYGNQVLITESTYQELDGEIPCRIIDRVRVKGKTRPIEIYAPIDSADAQEVSKHFYHAFEAYLAQDWDQAIELYRQGEEKIGGNDSYSQMMIERCQEYRQSPPEKGWDGVFTMTSK